MQTTPALEEPQAGSETLWNVVTSYRPGRVPVTMVTILLSALWFFPVIFSSIADSDSYFSHVSAIPYVDHISLFAAYAKVSASYYQLHPGWAPFGPLPLWLWLLDAPVLVIKFIQFSLILCAFVIFGLIARSLFRSNTGATLAVIATLCAWQFRTPHDPVVGTSLLTAWAAIFLLLPVLFWIGYRESSNAGWLAALWMSSLVALLTTPFALPFLAALSIAMVFARSTYAALGCALCIAAYAVMSWRLGVSPPLPWQHGGFYVINVFAQLFAAIPASFRSLGYLPLGNVPSLYHNGVRYVDDRFINVPAPDLTAWIAVFAITLAAFLTAKRLRMSDPVLRFEPLAAGLALWLIPAFFLGSPLMWRHGLPIGQAYDSVFFEYFGFGLVVAFCLVEVARRRPTALRLLPTLASVVAFALAYGNVRADAVTLSRYQKIDAARAVLERGGSAGFFTPLSQGSVIALDVRLPFAKGIDGRLDGARYAFYHYTKRVYRIENVNKLALPVDRNSWVLQLSPKRAIPIVLAHFAGRREHRILADHADGYTFSQEVGQTVVPSRRGVTTATSPLPDGLRIIARRTCGAVPIGDVFAEQRPTVTWGTGFFKLGPVGYKTPPPPVNAFGDVTIFPKWTVSGTATLWLNPTVCSPAFVNMRAVVVSTHESVLKIISPGGHIDKVALYAGMPAPFWVRYNSHTREPIKVQFQTDAPEADIDPVMFRYDKDIPRHARLIFEVQDRWEDTGNPAR